MRGLIFAMMFFALYNFDFGAISESKYNNPVSRYDMEVGMMDKDSTGKWRIYKNDWYGPEYLQLRTHDDDEKRDQVTYYIFDNDAIAQKAFENMPGNMYGISVNEENYVVGYDEGVCDAEIESLRYLDGNVIIYAELGVYGTWGCDTDDYVPPVRDTEIMDYILKNHEYLRDYANQTIQWILECKNY